MLITSRRSRIISHPSTVITTRPRLKLSGGGYAFIFLSFPAFHATGEKWKCGRLQSPSSNTSPISFPTGYLPPIFIGTLITRSHYRINVTFEHRKHARSLEEHPETKRYDVKDLRKNIRFDEQRRNFKQRERVRFPNAFTRGR